MSNKLPPWEIQLSERLKAKFKNQQKPIKMIKKKLEKKRKHHYMGMQQGILL
jgi:hypothetical protein